MGFTLKLWLVILTVGGLNYLSRLSFIAFFARRKMPPLLERALKFVPAAMLSSLIVPMVVGAELSASTLDPKIPAAMIALLVALRTASTLKTLVTGMVALWLLQLAFR